MGENMKKYSRIALSMISVLALATAAMAADPFAGTWKLNVAKSKFSSPAPKSEIITIVVRKNGSTWTFDTVDADGKSSHMGKYGDRLRNSLFLYSEFRNCVACPRFIHAFEIDDNNRLDN
jgi:hypothetical protein